MKEIEENFRYFTENHADIYTAYETYGKKVHQHGGPLEEKTRWLIKIAVSCTSGYSYALRTHISKAMKAGCSREEIEHALLLIAPTVGFPRMMEGIMILRQELA